MAMDAACTAAPAAAAPQTRICREYQLPDTAVFWTLCAQSALPGWAFWPFMHSSGSGMCYPLPCATEMAAGIR